MVSRDDKGNFIIRPVHAGLALAAVGAVCTLLTAVAAFGGDRQAFLEADKAHAAAIDRHDRLIVGIEASYRALDRNVAVMERRLTALEDLYNRELIEWRQWRESLNKTLSRIEAKVESKNP